MILGLCSAERQRLRRLRAVRARRLRNAELRAVPRRCILKFSATLTSFKFSCKWHSPALAPTLAGLTRNHRWYWLCGWHKFAGLSWFYCIHVWVYRGIYWAKEYNWICCSRCKTTWRSYDISCWWRESRM